MTGDDRAPVATKSPTTVRGDIQGLRALAVLLVIAAHSGLSVVAGGYIGVDVFFVISGFLITTLLLREAQRTGRVSLFGFYARRARRILPAATVVLIATCVASAVWLPVVRVGGVVTDAVWSGLFAANLRFASVETDYFAADRPVSPLQHYWSLSVEEQFYVIWPLLLLLVIFVLRRWSPASGVRRRVRAASGGVLAVLVVASLAWSVWATHTSPDTAYFSTLTRVWELGAGALLGVMMVRGGVDTHARPSWTTQVLALTGLAAIGLATIAFNDQTSFPGYLAAIPVLGAVALIAAGGCLGGQRTVVSRVLGWRPVRLIGDWSYSLYLWHFPVFVIARARWPEMTGAQRGGCLAAILALSVLTYYLVEEPFRRGRVWRVSWRSIALYPVGVGLVVGATFAANAVVDHRLALRADNPAIAAPALTVGLDEGQAMALVRASVLAAKERRPVPGRLVPDLRALDGDVAPAGDCDYDRTPGHRLCPEGDEDAERSIVLLGDSHARAWSPGVHAVGSAYGYRTYALAHTACPANLAFRLNPETGQRWPECEDFVQWGIDSVKELRPDLVIISSAPLAPVVDPDSGDVVPRDGNPDFSRAVNLGLTREIEAIKPYAGRVVVLGRTPFVPTPPGDCLSVARTLRECLAAPVAERRALASGFRAVAEAAGATYIDAEPWFCLRALCPGVIGDYIPLRDREHLTTAYARHLAPALAQALGLEEPTS